MLPREDRAIEAHAPGLAGRGGRGIRVSRERGRVDGHEPGSEPGRGLCGQGRPAGPGCTRELDPDGQPGLAALAELLHESDDLLECPGTHDGAGRRVDNAPDRAACPISGRGQGPCGHPARPRQRAQ